MEKAPILNSQETYVFLNIVHRNQNVVCVFFYREHLYLYANEFNYKIKKWKLFTIFTKAFTLNFVSTLASVVGGGVVLAAGMTRPPLL